MKELHAILGVRLFGNGPWLASGEAALSIVRKLQDLGLEEVIDRDTHRSTILGRELKVDLIEVFLGIFYEGEVPLILAEHGLLDSETAEDLMAREDIIENAEGILRPVVQNAFLRYFNPSGLCH